MTRIRYQDRELKAKYDNALADYQRTWAHVDAALRDVVQSHSGFSRSNVYTKVVLINGVYQAQLTRTLRRGALEKVTDALVAAGADVENAISKLCSRGALSREALPEIMTAHRVTLKALKAVDEELDTATPAKIVRSFTSKYLHFHSEIVPIYDSRASNYVGRFLSWPGYRQELRQLQESVPHTPEGDLAYFDYILKFWLLRERLGSLIPLVPVSTKGIDHMLWSENDLAIGGVATSDSSSDPA